MKERKIIIIIIGIIVAVGTIIISMPYPPQNLYASSTSANVTSASKNLTSHMINIFPARSSPSHHALARTSIFSEPDDDLNVLQLAAPALYVISPHTFRAAMVSASTKCDESLWSHIYHPYRLDVISPCITISGGIDAIKKEADGDYHIRLNADAQFANLTNQANVYWLTKLRIIS